LGHARGSVGDLSHIPERNAGYQHVCDLLLTALLESRPAWVEQKDQLTSDRCRLRPRSRAAQFQDGTLYGDDR
jgi:hypothetical protein